MDSSIQKISTVFTPLKILQAIYAEGVLEIEPSEAEIVRMIFFDYLSGMGQTAIAKKLNEMGIPTRQGNLWTSPRIREILVNEKYTGKLILQKYYRNNHIEKR